MCDVRGIICGPNAPEQWFYHPVTMTTGYVDTSPVRKLEYLLSPKPDTIGAFYSESEALEYVSKCNYTIVNQFVLPE